jgi:hypothetical protein
MTHTRTTRGLSVATQPLVNKNYRVKSRYLVLTYVATSGIINVVGSRSTKGGCCDNDGQILNSRGGGNRTGYDALFCQGDVAQRRDARTQNWLKVAHRSGRVCGVEKAETESVQAVSGKLNSSSVAQQVSPLIGTHQAKPAAVCYLIVYFAIWQRNRQGVAGRDSQ